ncbi:MAG: PilN domain-containing protein [Wenzhouxiangella sp.]|jgi:general secretion pathway protein L|nr:PilN domain-containing protein [Wenzhouxiangella sp.]MDR9452556.1 PilN domain-containing protein [Wenzhouxiangella sp.]
MIQERINEWTKDLTARYQKSALPAFFEWWWGELSPLIPEHLKTRWVPPAPSLWLIPTGETGQELAIWRWERDGQRVDVFGADEPASSLKTRWQALLDAFEFGAPRVVLCLPPDGVLDRAVELPLAVEANLHQAVHYQLDQLTPFEPSAVYFDQRITHRDIDNGRLQVALRVAPVQGLMDWIDRLDSLGIEPHIIDRLADVGDGSAPAREGFNLLPEAKRPAYVYERAQLNWRLAGLATLVLVVVMAGSLYLRDHSVDRLETQVAQLRSEAQQVMALQRQLGEAVEAANFLAEKRSQAPVMMHVLDEVTQLLPSQMWLQQMQVRGEELTMMGYARGSQRLIELLNDNGLFADATFRGRVTIDPETEQERFTVQAMIDRRSADAVAARSGE